MMVNELVMNRDSVWKILTEDLDIGKTVPNPPLGGERMTIGAVEWSVPGGGATVTPV